MILYFLRHGRAVDSNPDGDDARPLTDAGEAVLRAGAATWRRLNFRPDAVVCSPLVRARQTAELFCAAMGGRPELDDRLRPGAQWNEFGRVLADRPDARRLLFIGHEPDLSATIALLTGAASVRMRAGGVACVEFPGVPEPGGGEIAWLIDPDVYVEPG